MEISRTAGAGVGSDVWAFTMAVHHRGQAEAYLRVKNIKPPAYRF